MRVSVVIPCFNSLRFLPETLDSVLTQELDASMVDDVEVVLVDDGGDDDLAGWAARRDDPRVRVVRQENAGVSAARNRGIAESRGELIAFCDSDDLWTPTTLSSLARSFLDAPRVGLAYGWYDVVDAEGRPTGRVSRGEWEGQIWDRLVTENPIAASGVMVRRAALDDVGVFAVNRDRFRIDVEDWELWIRIAARWDVALVREIVAHHRRHDSNSSTDVESIEAAYRNLLEVVFADVEPERARVRPLAEGRIQVRLASHWLHDRQDPERALGHLDRAVEHCPELRRSGEVRRLRLTARVLRATGEQGYEALRTANRLTRVARERIRSLRQRVA